MHHIRPIFDIVQGHRRSEARMTGQRLDLPFLLWVTIAATFGSDMPSLFRTYRGLTLTDTEELDQLRQENEFALEYAPNLNASIDAMPTFFLTLLDLRKDTTFGDSDIPSLRPLAPHLSALRLDGCKVSDDGLRWISRATTGEGSYQRLEVLTLSKTEVTSKGIVGLAKLPLRMLDLRFTKCDEAIASKLNDAVISTFRWSKANRRHQLRGADQTLEFELFGGQLSLARIVSKLHGLARLRGTPGANQIDYVKPVSVFIDTRRRAPEVLSAAATSAGIQRFIQAGDMAGSDDDVNMVGQHKPAVRKVFHPVFGQLTSSNNISDMALHESAAEYNSRAAFSARNDAVVSGQFIGVRETAAPTIGTSLFDVGTRKLSYLSYDSGPLSDTEDEQEVEVERERLYLKEVDDWEREQMTRLDFYRRPKPAIYERRVRTAVLAAPSPYMLLRHLPFKLPHQMEWISTLDAATDFVALKPEFDETTLCKKKVKTSVAPVLVPITSSSSPPVNNSLEWSDQVRMPSSSTTLPATSSPTALKLWNENGRELLVKRKTKPLTTTKTPPANEVRFGAAAKTAVRAGSARQERTNLTPPGIAKERDAINKRGNVQMKDRQKSASAWSFKKDTSESRRGLKAFRRM
ncbi:hypothetical protein OIO90_002993 [Microbotryomycetes sp. JL221]|nr:hypothetical protein OIO90_002993 [Microbotryomycetes sp. JL221]